jgi:Tol biopolymer transport system component/DNA-binding winged helix-turn-helix (wHTH) protein
MAGQAQRTPAFRFGVFELDPASGELRKNGVRIRLQEQPRQVLLLLLDHPGEVVTREQIQKQIWQAGTFVDFDNAINSAIRKLRDALGDSADNPRFIETLARRGYRFLAPVSIEAGTAQSSPSVSAAPAIVETPASRRTIVVFALLVCAAAFLAWIGSRSIAAKETPLAELETKSTTLTGNDGIELQPSFSPDGTRIAYASRAPREENFSVYVKLIGPGDPVRLTQGPYSESSPSWSPDGRWIAVVRELETESAVMLVPASGGHPQELARIIRLPHLSESCPSCYPGSFLAWSPDGKSLFTAARSSLESPIRITRISVETGAQQPLTHPSLTLGGADTLPAVSPDGRSLAFVRMFSLMRGDIFVAQLSPSNAILGEVRRITSDNADIRSLAWTPDGKQFIFSSNRGGRQRLWRLNATRPGSPVSPLHIGEDASEFAISPRGDLLVYGRGNFHGSLWKAPLDTAGAAGPERIVATSARIIFPAYSPDSARIAFQSARSGADEVWVCDADGANVFQLTKFGKSMSGSPSWSPDGQTIAFDSNVDGEFRIYVIPSRGGQPTLLTPNQFGGVPRWSRDGRWIYYTTLTSGQMAIWKVPSHGGPRSLVAKNGAFPVESPDGKHLYYIRQSEAGSILSEIMKIAVAGGSSPSKIIGGVTGRLFTVTARGIYFTTGAQQRECAPDNRLIALISSKPPKGGGSENPSSPEMRFFDFNTGSTRIVASVGELPHAAISHDGHWALYARNEFVNSNLMVVENFR